jgi:hypothetical protein
MPVTPGMRRTPCNGIRIFHFEQMNLLVAHPHPGTGKAQIGSRRVKLHAEYIQVKFERPLAVRYHDTGVVNL